MRGSSRQGSIEAIASYDELLFWQQRNACAVRPFFPILYATSCV